MAAVGDVYKMAVVCAFGVQRSVNVRHWRVTAVTGAGRSDSQIAIALSTVFAPLWKNLMNVNAAWTNLFVQKVRPLPAAIPRLTNADAGAGLVAGDPLPPQTCGLIALQTALAGRSFRGRIYVPFPGEAHSGVDGMPVGAYLAALDNLAVALTTARVVASGGDSVSFQPVIYNAATGATTDIAEYRVRIVWATQRRRSFASKPDA